MGLFGKKKKPEEEKEMSPPPNFPEMEEVKRAIRPIESPILTALPPPPLLPYPRLMPAVTEKIQEKPFAYPPVYAAYPAAEIPTEMPEAAISRRERIVEETEEFPKKKAKEPIYVKIEHFKAALAIFGEIKGRLRDSFELLDKIKETRAEEKEKIDSWEKEIEGIKEKIAEIDNKLFSKVE